MSASFVAASSQRIVNSAEPITGVAFTVGFWVYPTTTGTLRAAWALADSGVNNHQFIINQSSGNTWQFQAAAGGSFAAATAGTVTANQWYYIVARAITTTNRRLAVLSNAGSAHAQSTTSRNPSSIDTMSLGMIADLNADSPFSGLIAEFWSANADVQADGAQLQEALLWRLTYGGPFSVPHLVRSIVDYVPLRVFAGTGADNVTDYHGRFGRQTWTPTNAPTVGPHPPLPYWYVKPGQVKTQLVI